jgi:hypothetical protein
MDGGELLPERLLVEQPCDCPPVLVMLACGRIMECEAVRVPDLDLDDRAS